MVNQATTVLIMAGGTGGHVFPALATAEQLSRRGVSVEWLGTATGIEAELVAKAGFPISFITVSGVRGKGMLSLLGAPFQLARAITQAVNHVRRIDPQCVLGMGGFASGPGGIAAWLLRRPLVIHEQNAIAGTTNRILARFAKLVLQAFPKALANGRLVGNPIREAITHLDAPEQRMNERATENAAALRVLVLGGSLGAAALNETLPAAVALIREQGQVSLDIWHQTGKRHIDAARGLYDERGVIARVDAFIDDMADAYRWADVIVCRSGALTVSEIAAAGVGAILVPFPHAIDDHQTANAQWLVDHGAAVLMPQATLTAENLAQQLTALAAEPDRLLNMARKARAQAKPDAAQHVAEICLEVAHG